MKRRQFLTQVSVAAATVLDAGGGRAAEPLAAATPGPSQARGPAPASASGLPTLMLHPSSSGTQPYFAAVYPLEGAVASNQTLESEDDPTLRGSVLSRWPDGSASVVVLGGEIAVTAGSAKFVRLRPGNTTGTSLKPARIGQLVSDVSISFGALGNVLLTDFSVPHKIWWANERLICCRYRVPIGSDATLEALIDIHAFSSNHAFVEIVVENGKVNSSSSAPSAPANKSYTATVSVNGSAIATVTSSSGPGGVHQPFRAWYASTWVNGDPGIAVTHDAAAMQAHPMLHKVWKAGNSKAAYATDAYTPWTAGRWPKSEMDAGGDSPQIGSLTKWDSDYLQTGDANARNGVITNALALLSFNLNYRDSTTGLVPSAAQTIGKRMAGQANWPATYREPQHHTSNPLAWEVSHHGAAGLIAFLCRPSPVFIEIAQKIAAFNGANMSTNWVHGVANYQCRGVAWCARSLAHAIYLTPDAFASGELSSWKRSAKEALYRNVQYWTATRALPNPKGNCPLGFVLEYSVDSGPDLDPTKPGMQRSTFQDEFFITEVCKVANSKLLSRTQQVELSAIADAACQFPIRFVNESINCEFRAIGASQLTVSSHPEVYVESNWAAVQAFQFPGDPPPGPGKWLSGRNVSTYSALTPEDSSIVAGATSYGSLFWSAFSTAVERNVSGASTAWDKVVTNGGITNLSTWADGFADDPRHGFYPRTK